MSPFEVRYLMSGIAHLPYLIVSLRSLRRFYGGPVVVYAFRESYDIARTIAEDRALRIEVRLWDRDLLYVPSKRKNIQFINKIRMMQQGDGFACYLDADTIIAGPLDELFQAVSNTHFVGTQFCDWVTTGSIIRGRIERMRGRDVDQDLVERVLSHPYPSPNGGIFVCLNKSPMLPLWEDWSKLMEDVFICDETVLQILPLKFGDMKILTGGKFNCSTKYRALERPSIWHGHGNSFTRPQKSPYGWELWSQEMAGCLEDNIGSCQQWFDACKQKHQWLKQLEISAGA